MTIATLLAFWQVTRGDFINYDDTVYITENTHIHNGLTIDGILWAFTTGHATNWHPLTWISHMVDVDLFGLDPHGHHLMSLLFHIANTLLLFLVLHRMTKALWQSAFVAALFALHPLHVESVAWAAERKDVLSTFFWMLTMGAYCYYVERPSPRRYVPVLLFFALGLMAKPMLVTLPFVLLLLDYWPLGRLEQPANKPRAAAQQKGKSGKKEIITKKETRTPAGRTYQWVSIGPLLREKIPLFLLVILSSMVTYGVQQKGGAVKSVEVFPLNARIENAFVSYAIYIEKMIWPHDLAIFYPYQGQWASWQVVGAVLFFLAVTMITLGAARRFRYLTVGWLWYAGTLVPVIGLVQVGNQAMADRYTYVPLIGLFIMAAWGIPELLGRWRYREKALIASSIVALSCCFVVTWTQVGYWRNEFTLFGRALKVTENNYVAYNNRGAAYEAHGDHGQAIADYDRAIGINPAYARACYNRGNAYAALGNQKQAIADYDRAIGINPAYALAYYNRGNAYAALGTYDRAIADYGRAIECSPGLELAYNNRGNAYAALGDRKRAIEDYDKATEINPRFAAAYYNRAVSYDRLGNQKQAMIDYERAGEINPGLAGAHGNRRGGHNPP
ncbi:MAG: tetratricopeptide repeat protein [Syntrophorhabdales bacterium]